MATKKKTATDDDEALKTRLVGVRVTDADYARIERLTGRLSVSAIVRAALLVGLDVVEAQPGVILGETPRPPKGWKR